MSTDFSIKPVGAPATIAVAQPVSDAKRHAVATELPASQSVTVVEAVAGIPNDPRPASDMVLQRAFFDREAASIVYRAIGSRTDIVLTQCPDDATLRRRAYFGALGLARNLPTRRLATDRKA